MQAILWYFCHTDVLSFVFLQIFGSHYGIPFQPFPISLLAKIWLSKHCFIIAFSVFFLCVFADIFLFLLLLPLPFCVAFVSRWQFFPAIWCATPPPLLCVSHLHRACGCTWCFSVPPWCLRGVFWGSCVFFVAFAVAVPCVVSSPLVFAGCCWCVLVSWSVGCPVASCVVRVVSGVCCVFVWCLCSSVGSVLFWVVRCFVVLLVLVLLCFVCGCSSVCVAPPGCCSSSGWLWWLCFSVRFFAPGGVAGVFPLLCVAPSCCWLLVLLVVGLVVLLSPLFLVRHDQVCLCWLCGLTQNATLVGWLLWCGVLVFSQWFLVGFCCLLRICPCSSWVVHRRFLRFALSSRCCCLFLGFFLVLLLGRPASPVLFCLFSFVSWCRLLVRFFFLLLLFGTRLGYLGRALLSPLRWILLVVLLSFACCLWAKCLASGVSLLLASILFNFLFFATVFSFFMLTIG